MAAERRQTRRWGCGNALRACSQNTGLLSGPLFSPDIELSETSSLPSPGVEVGMDSPGPVHLPRAGHREAQESWCDQRSLCAGDRPGLLCLLSPFTAESVLDRTIH